MSDARRAADMRLANGEITLEKHSEIVGLLYSGSGVNDARSAVDMRLAKGEISAAEHKVIVSQLDGDVISDPVEPGVQSYGGVTLLAFGLIGVAIYLIQKRSDQLAACRLKVGSYLADKVCVPTSTSGLIIGALLIAGVVLLFGIWAKKREAAKLRTAAPS